jgi:hypothetical protein
MKKSDIVLQDIDGKNIKEGDIVLYASSLTLLMKCCVGIRTSRGLQLTNIKSNQQYYTRLPKMQTYLIKSNDN